MAFTLKKMSAHFSVGVYVCIYHDFTYPFRLPPFYRRKRVVMVFSLRKRVRIFRLACMYGKVRIYQILPILHVTIYSRYPHFTQKEGSYGVYREKKSVNFSVDVYVCI